MTMDGDAGSTYVNLERPRAQGRSALLDGLPAHEMEQVEGRLSPVSCKAGSTLVAQGSWHGMMYVLRGGALAVHVQTVHGKVRQLARLVPGDCVGEMSLLVGSPASATVTAVVDSELWALGHAEFLQLLASCPTLARNMATILSRRLSLTNVATDSNTIRWMRLRMHPDLPPELAEAVARAVAFHLAIPLPVLDQRRSRRWQPGEELPSIETALEDYRVAQRLRSLEAPGVVVVPMDNVADETAGRLQEWISSHVTHVLTLEDIARRNLRPFDDVEQPTSEVTLYPTGEQVVLPGAGDVALISARAQMNTRAELERESRSRGARVVRILSPNADDTDGHVGWLGRHLAGLKVGLALGGGGARGYAHLGVLRGLERAGVPLDYLGGCSIGAVVASGCAFGVSLDDMLREMDAARSHLLKYTVSRKSVLSERGVEYFVRERLFGDARIEDLHLPLAIVAVDVLQRHKVVMERGLVWKALRASTAIPGVYPPVWIGEHCLIDGGILDPVPADITRTMGADVVLGVRLGGVSHQGPVAVEATDARTQGRSPHFIDTMMRAFDTMAAGITSRVVQDADVTLVADVPPIGLREFARGRTFVPAGQVALEQEWTQITTLLPWLRSSKLGETE